MTSTIIYQRLEYVYLIRHIPSGRFYAGSSYKKDCHPDQLWTTYFTSSKYIKDLIAQDGTNSFEVLEVIPRPLSDARSYEALLLKSVNAAKSVKWINKSNGDSKLLITRHTDETKNKLSSMKLGIPLGPQSQSHKDKIKAALKLVPKPTGWNHSEETKEKIKQSNKGIPRPKSAEWRAAVSAKTKGISKPQTLKECPHCHLVTSAANISRWHGEKCKFKMLSQ